MVDIFCKEAEKYYDSIRKIRENSDYIEKREKIYAQMDAYKEDHPKASMMELKGVLYERLVDAATPILFKHSPFFFEMGMKDALSMGGAKEGYWSIWGTDLSIRKATELDYIKELGYTTDIEYSPELLGVAIGPVFDEDHHSLGYTRLFQKGVRGIIQDIDKMLAGLERDDERYDFYIAAKCGLLALIRAAKRFADAADAEIGCCCDEQSKRYMRMIVEAAVRIPAEPPKSFYEGLEMLIFMREVTASLDGVGISVLGHVDRLLGPLYEEDIRCGRLTRDEAAELVEIWLAVHDIKCGAKTHKWADISTCIELGGCDEEGKTVFNEVTKLFIEVHERLGIINPKLNCRISTRSPEEYLELIAVSLLKGHNTIALLNDNVIIPALMSSGHELCDARLYVNGGCQETIVEGCEHSAGVLMYFNLPRILDLSLNPINTDSFCQRTIENLPQIIDGAQTFDDFYEKYLENMKAMLSYVADIRRPFGEKWRQVHPCPMFSSTLKGCIENGKDYTAGGAKYNPSTISAFGFATLADSLFAIKKAVYDESIVTLDELKKALLMNFDGYEILQAKLKAYPKFGHSVKEIDEFASKVLDDINAHVMTIDNERGDKYILSTFTFANHVWAAPFVRATADGRSCGEVLSQSVGPSRVTKTRSVSEAVISLNSLNLDKTAGVAVLDVMLPSSPGMTPKALVPLFYAFAQSGGQVLQPNYVTYEQLIAARDDPDKYRDLMVRVCGLSVYFVNLKREFQEDIISRNRYVKN